MRTCFLIFLMLIGKFCLAQSTGNSRPPFSLKLFVNDSTFYQAQMGETMFVIDKKTVQIFPGEKLFIEADLMKDSLVNLKVVPEIINKEKTLTIVFMQENENKLHKQMRLTITNPFSKQLEYSAQINLMKYKKWVKTSVVPVQPGLVSYEMWPDIITTVALYNFHLKTKKSDY